MKKTQFLITSKRQQLKPYLPLRTPISSFLFHTALSISVSLSRLQCNTSVLLPDFLSTLSSARLHKTSLQPSHAEYSICEARTYLVKKHRAEVRQVFACDNKKSQNKRAVHVFPTSTEQSQLSHLSCRREHTSIQFHERSSRGLHKAITPRQKGSPLLPDRSQLVHDPQLSPQRTEQKHLLKEVIQSTTGISTSHRWFV